MSKITVLLADDHTIVREGLRILVELDRGLEVVGEARDGRQAVALILKLRPQVVLMDIAMPQLNGLEATRQVLKAFPSAKVLILSAHNDDAYVQAASESGASGFLLKLTSAQEICEAIHKIHAGGSFYAPSASKRLNHQAAIGGRGCGAVKPKAVRLTSREAEVLQLIAEGRANKETASELNISLKTVEKHRQHLMAKLDIHDTAGLTRYAISTGVIECSVQLTIV